MKNDWKVARRKKTWEIVKLVRSFAEQVQTKSIPTHKDESLDTEPRHKFPCEQSLRLSQLRKEKYGGQAAQKTNLEWTLEDKEKIIEIASSRSSSREYKPSCCAGPLTDP